MSKLYLIAGHTQGKDEGAQNLKTKETENIIARKLLLDVFPQVKKLTFTDLCPFDLTLKEKIAWINKRAKNEDMVLSCHLNSSPKRKETGAMCFYYGGSEKSKAVAEKLLEAYCKETGLRNAGVHPDTSSRFGRLGIVRDTRGWSFLLELGSINNDLPIVKEKSERGLVAAVHAMVTALAGDMPFSDVNRTHPYFSAAQWAKQEGVANGYEDGRVGIDENLSVGRFFAFLQKYDKARR